MVVPNMDVHYKQVNLEFTFTFYIYITKFFHLFIQSFIFSKVSWLDSMKILISFFKLHYNFYSSIRGNNVTLEYVEENTCMSYVLNNDVHGVEHIKE